MYSLMIVDDEEIILNGIGDVVRASGLPLRSVQTARSAGEALSLLTANPCDILLTDIRMPDMDGLEMVGRAKALWPDIRVIFLTGYRDFEYATAALRLDSDDFLVKPAPDGKLLEAIERVIVALDKAWMGRFLSSGGGGLRDAGDGNYGIRNREKELRLIFLKIDIHSARISEKEIWEGLQNMLERVLNHDYSRIGFDRYGAGNYVARLSESKEEYQEQGTSALSSDPGTAASSPMGRKDTAAEIRIRRVLEEVQSFFLEQLDIGMSVGISEKTCMEEESAQCTRWEEMCGTEYGKLFMMGEIRGGGREEPTAEGNYVVYAVQAYVRENPEKDLSLGALSERFRLNPSYLSRIFSQETGQPLSEYILQIRIALAKRLLEETELRIYEIAERTGFGTPGYFTRVFRGAEGLSPKAYRLNMGR